MPLQIPVAAGGGGTEAGATQPGLATPASKQDLGTTSSTSMPMPQVTVAVGGGAVAAMPIQLASTTIPPSAQELATTLLSSIPLLQVLPPMPGAYAIAPLMWGLATTTSASTPQPDKHNAAMTRLGVQSTAQLT